MLTWILKSTINNSKKISKWIARLRPFRMAYPRQWSIPATWKTLTVVQTLYLRLLRLRLHLRPHPFLIMLIRPSPQKAKPESLLKMRLKVSFSSNGKERESGYIVVSDERKSAGRNIRWSVRYGQAFMRIQVVVQQQRIHFCAGQRQTPRNKNKKLKWILALTLYFRLLYNWKNTWESRWGFR